MSKNKNKQQSPVSQPKTVIDENNPLIQILKGITAKVNKRGTEVVISYKEKHAIVPTISQLPVEVYFEWFDEIEEQDMLKLGEMVPAMARHFMKNSEEYRNIVTGCTTQEAMAIILAWWNAQGNASQLKK